MLDALFASLADQMLTLLERRQCGWGRHLDVEHHLEPAQPATLFARETRYPDFLSMLRGALRDEIIDAHLYGRALRSIDARELDTEQRIAELVRACLDHDTVTRLLDTGAGLHLGCYNWLLLGARHAPARAHVLRRLPWLASFLSETLVPMDAALLAADSEVDADGRDHDAGEAAALGMGMAIAAPPRPRKPPAMTRCCQSKRRRRVSSRGRAPASGRRSCRDP